MSDSQAYEEVTAVSDGVTVVKRFEEDEFPVPAIAFEFASDRDEEVTIRLVDDVPEGVAVEDLGFHPEYGSEYWTIDEDQITFERDLGANSEYTSVYGIRATGTDDVEQFLTEPSLEDIDPPLPESETEAAASDGGDEVIPESDDDVVRDVISGEAEDVPGLEDDEEATDEEVETLDLKDPNESGAAGGAAEGDAPETEAAEDGDAEADSGDEAGAASGEAAEPADVDLDTGSIVAALANEIRQNNVSAEDVKLLRQAFEIAGQEGGSVVARIQRLQSDVSDLRAYSDALEEFLDDSGTAQQVIDGFESDLDDLEGRLESMEGELQGNAEEIDSLSSEVERIEDEVAEVSEGIDSVETAVDDIEGDVDEVSSDVTSVRNEVNGVNTSVDDLQEAIDDLEAELDEVKDNVSDGDVEGRIEDLESNLEDLQDWQDQIKSTFGG